MGRVEHFLINRKVSFSLSAGRLPVAKICPPDC
jgi:hypothetical protein